MICYKFQLTQFSCYFSMNSRFDVLKTFKDHLYTLLFLTVTCLQHLSLSLLVLFRIIGLRLKCLSVRHLCLNPLPLDHRTFPAQREAHLRNPLHNNVSFRFTRCSRIPKSLKNRTTLSYYLIENKYKYKNICFKTQ